MVAVILAIAIIVVSFLFTILCFCHYRYHNRDSERKHATKYANDHRKGILEAMKTIKEMSKENNSSDDKKWMLEMTSDLIEALTDAPSSLNQALLERNSVNANATPEPQPSALSNSNCVEAMQMSPLSPPNGKRLAIDSGELIGDETVDTQVARRFADVADRMLNLVLTHHTHKNPLKEALQNIPQLGLMTEVKVGETNGRI